MEDVKIKRTPVNTSISGVNGFCSYVIPISVKIISASCNLKGYRVEIYVSDDGFLWAFKVADYSGNIPAIGTELELYVNYI